MIPRSVRRFVDRPRRSFRFRNTVRAMAAFSLIFACTGQTAPTSEVDTEPDATTSQSTNPQSSEERPSLVISLDTDVTTLEPHTFRSTGSFAVTGALYDELLRERLEQGDDGIWVGTRQFEGNLAESWSISDDGLEATFLLRDGIKFASGEPITAEDFQWSLTKAIDGPGFVDAQLPFIGLTESSTIEAPDNRTLMLRPLHSSPLLEQFMSYQNYTVMDRSAVEEQASSNDPWGVEWLSRHPTPSGPYTLVEYDPDSQVVLAPNPEYWDPDFPRNGGLTIRFVPDGEQRALLVQRGELDFANGIPSRMLEVLSADPNVQVYRTPSTALYFLGMNVQTPPFDDVNVRQAISYAAPYDALVEEVLHGFGNTAGGFVSRNMDTYAGDEIGTYETDLERAQELLSEAGVEALSLELAVLQSKAEDQEAAVFIQDNLRQIGIDVEILVLPDGEFFTRLNNGELPFFLHYWYQWGEDPFVFMTFLVKTGSFTNYTRFSNARLDEIIEEATLEPDEGRRAELSREAQEILLEEAPMAYLYNRDWAAVARPEVSGINRDLTEIPRLEWLSKEAG